MAIDSTHDVFSDDDLVTNWHTIFGQCCNHEHDRCCVAPDPKLQKKINKALIKMRKKAPDGMEGQVSLREQTRVGFNDGLIVPGTHLPLGTPPMAAKNFALERAPLTGDVRVVVVLAEFSDQQFNGDPAQRFNDLFFSTGNIATGSVKEYFDDVTNGIVNIIGEVVGPYTLPDTLANYAGGSYGTDPTKNPNARDMAEHAATAADPDIDFRPYDNDGDDFVDAYVVVHAGTGAEQTGSGGDIWSHKWAMRDVVNVDGTQLYAYLTIPEDARLGVCAHELGHLLFGFPDLYDTDRSSSGIGNWCLMAGGSWNGGGDTPAHPSAWCKANQGWVTVTNVTSNGMLSIPDVKNANEIFRLWKDGNSSQEYFLVENRQRTGFDADLPGDGLLIWHIDDAIAANSDENHPKVALEQADGLNHLNSGTNRGDTGDSYPGSTGAHVFDKNSFPNSKSYAGSDTCVAVSGVSASSATMTANLSVKCAAFKSILKELTDKHHDKFHRFDKYFFADKYPEKPEIDKRVGREKPFDFNPRTRFGFDQAPPGHIEERLEALETTISALVPFIDEDLRPDLSDSMLNGEADLEKLRTSAKQSEAYAKRLLDSPRR